MSTPIDSSVYYRGVYWNSYDRVIEHLNERAFDSGQGNWCEYLRRENGMAYPRAFSLNCGTGWAERDLITAGAAQHIVAVDYLDDLLTTAREASIGMPISYHQTDANNADFPPGPYDLLVNHAAGHHITYVDKVFRHLREIIEPTGSLVTWDYTGPHRNQYTPRIWNAALQVNSYIPDEYRSSMEYPHLPTMVLDDPTEAVHSELVLEVMSRYFHHRHFRALGGPIAYLILTHNIRLHSAPPAIRDPIVEMVLAADVEHVESYPGDSLFTFAISSPRAETELDPVQLELWTYQEECRENDPEANGGRYYLPTKLEQSRYLSTVADPDTGEVLLRPYDVARLGPRFVFGAVARLIPITFPITLPLLRWLNRTVRAVRRKLRG